MENFQELAKTCIAILDVIQSEPTPASLRRLVDRISPMLKILDNDPDTVVFRKWADVMAEGMQTLLRDEMEMESLRNFVICVHKSLDNNILTINNIESQQDNENLMKGLVWLPNRRSTGHFAFDMCTNSQDDYISFWPKATKSEYLFGVHGCKLSTYDKDVDAEDGDPRVFQLYTLNKLKMIVKLEELKGLMESGVIKYKALTPLSWNETGQGDEITHNCCTFIWSLLVEGGIQNLINETMFEACKQINVITGLGNFVEVATPSDQKMSLSADANPWSMFNILTVVTHAEERHFSGLPSLTSTDDLH